MVVLRVVSQHPVIEDVMGAYAPALGAACRTYSAHAYRVYNIACAVLGNERCSDELAVASAFHDLGIWSDGTWDYIEPSIARARDYLRERAAAVNPVLVEEAVRHHHKLRPFRGSFEPAVIEAFRRADLIDVSGGLIRMGLPRAFLRELAAAFPYAGFHRELLRAAGAWCVRHPLRPLPMVEL